MRWSFHKHADATPLAFQHFLATKFTRTEIEDFQAITSTLQTCTKQLRKTRPHPNLSGNNGSWAFLGFLSVRTESAGCVALFFKFLENALRSPTQFCGKCAKCHLDPPG